MSQLAGDLAGLRQEVGGGESHATLAQLAALLVEALGNKVCVLLVLVHNALQVMRAFCHLAGRLDGVGRDGHA